MSYRIILLVSGVFFLSCVYFNTFYNASAAFDAAQKEHSKYLIDHSERDTTLRLPHQIVSNYDRAIEKSAKILEFYPSKKKWHDDALFLIARSYYYKGEAARAIRRLKQLQQEFPQSPFIPESYLYLGKAYLKDGNITKAEEVFSYILEHYPGLNKNEEISLLQVELSVRQGSRAQATSMLEKSIAGIKSQEKKLELSIQLAQLYIELKQYNKALAILKKLPRLKEYIRYSFKVDSLQFSCYMKIDSLEAALRLTNKMLNRKEYNAFEPLILMQKAMLLTELGRIEESVALYEQIRTVFDTSSVCGLACYALGSIYLKKGDFLKAKEYFTLALSKLADEEIKERAKHRSAAIDSILLYSDSAGAKGAYTVDDFAWRRFKVGELFWLELEQPDSAYNRFILLASDSTIGSQIRSQSLFAAAWIARHAFGDSAASDTLLNELIREYPASSYAKHAQKALGKDIVITTREDSAEALFRTAESLYIEGGNTKSAIEKFISIYRAYRDLDIGAKSILVAAWLCDDYLEKNWTALALYDTLCRVYPKSQYCIQKGAPRIRSAKDTIEARGIKRKDDKEDKRVEKTDSTENTDSSVSGSFLSTEITDGKNLNRKDDFPSLDSSDREKFYGRNRLKRSYMMMRDSVSVQ